MPVLKTTSPATAVLAPKLYPLKVQPSSRTRVPDDPLKERISLDLAEELRARVVGIVRKVLKSRQH